jgi:hypothetical protein
LCQSQTLIGCQFIIASRFVQIKVNASTIPQTVSVLELPFSQALIACQLEIRCCFGQINGNTIPTRETETIPWRPVRSPKWGASGILN